MPVADFSERTTGARGEEIARLPDGRSVTLVTEGPPARLAGWAGRLANVRHPGVPVVERFDERCAALERVEGIPLGDRLVERGGGLEEPDALSIVLQIAAAVQAAHVEGVTHEHIAPETVILLDRPGDLPAARLVGWRPPSDRPFADRVLADVRGLHGLLYTLLTGRNIADTMPPGQRPAEWVELDLTDGGLGRPGLVALARTFAYDSVTAFIDELVPWYRDLIDEAADAVSALLSGADEVHATAIAYERERLGALMLEAARIRRWLARQPSDAPFGRPALESALRRERLLVQHGDELARLLGHDLGPATPVLPAASDPVAATPPLNAGRVLVATMSGLVVLLAFTVWFLLPEGPRADRGPNVVAVAPAADEEQDEDAAAPEPTVVTTTAVEDTPVAPDAAVAPAEPVAPAAAPPPFIKPKPPEVLPPPPDGMVGVRGGALHAALSKKAAEQVLSWCRQDARRAWWPARCNPDALASELQPFTRRVGSFFIDRTEVSQGQWDECRRDGACKRKRLSWERPEHPVTGVTRAMAADYCEWKGGRLPTADEWTYAARGGANGRIFPWGDAHPSDGGPRANHGRTSREGGRPSGVDDAKFIAKVGAYGEKGASPFGALDMGGNVREWTATGVRGDAVVMGGGWRDPAFELRVTRRERFNAGQFADDVGFRCVREI